MRSVVSTTRAPSTRVDRARRSRPSASGPAASTVMSRTARSSSTSTRSTAPIDAAGLADRARHPPEHARAVVDLDADREASTGRRGCGHRRAEHTASARSWTLAVRTWPTRPPDELFLIDGNSLAYRAFFALPESIATSTGFPTNAIFGFASMLVKILTEHGAEADGRGVGRRARPGARRSTPSTRPQRTTRPDLLERAVAAPRAARRGVRLPQRDASTATRPTTSSPRSPSARATQGVPVDRSSPATATPSSSSTPSRACKVMATVARDHRHEALRPPGGHRPLRHPARADPRLLRPQGRHVGQHPRRPGHRRQDRRPSCCSSSATSRRVLARVDEISGAKRKENLTNHADDARISKQLATMQRDVAGRRSTRATRPAREPDRSRLREVFREFELRDPLRRLEEALGDADAAAPAPAAETTRRRARARRARSPTSRGLPAGAEVALAVRAPETPEGELFAPRTPWRFGVAARRARCSSATCDAPEELVAAARRPAGRSPTTPRRCGAVPPNLAHDTLLGAYLLEPARRGFPFRELVEERGLAADVDGPGRPPTRVLVARAGRLAARADRRARADARSWTRSSCRSCACCARWRSRACGSNVERLRRDQPTRVRDEVARRSSARSGTWPATEFVIGSPQQLGEILFDKLGLSKKRRGKTGFSTDARVLQAIRDEHEIIPQDRALARAQPARQDLPRRAARSSSTRESAHPHDVRAGRRPRPGGWPRRTRTCRTSRSAPSSGREIRGCFEAGAGQRADSAPTTRRSSCGSSPTSPTSRCSRRSSCAARTCTPRPRRRSSSKAPDGPRRRWTARRPR